MDDMTDRIEPTMIPAWVDGTLMPVEKLEVHERGLRHKAVSVFVVTADRILIQKRAATKYHTPGLWANACCTHPHWNEDDLTCAERRLAEELGIAGLTLDHRGAIEYRADVGGGLTEHEVAEIYVGTATEDLSTALNPSEVEAVRWVAPDTLADEIAEDPDRFTPWLRIYLRDHHHRIFGEG